VREGAAVQAGYVLVAFGAAWANRATKDITSLEFRSLLAGRRWCQGWRLGPA
jgi:hypothetical protein